jgi:hypothetical protein
MPSTSLFLKALGLAVSPNRLTDQPGTLLQASNVIIKRDNIVEPRRGFQLYGDAFGSSSDRADQLFTYKNRILRHFDTTMQFDTQVVDQTTNLTVFDNFAGSFSNVQPGLRMKWIEANGNLYFTTSDGIQKISATSANQFTTSPGYITTAGGIQALDFTARLDITNGLTTGFFTQDSVVAYRTLWNTNDATGNLIQGTPSARVQITNPLLNLIINDFDVFLVAMDYVASSTGSKYPTANFASTLNLSNTATAFELLTNIIAFSNKLDTDPGPLFTSGDITSATITSGVCTITLNDTVPGVGVFGRLQVGDEIYLNGFIPATTGTLNGPQIVTQITNTGGPTTISFATTATGTVSLSSANIEQGWFRTITPAAFPAQTIASDQELVAIQTYLQSILTELQSGDNLKIAALENTLAAQYPLKILTAAVSTATTLTVNFDTSSPNTDARNNFRVGDLVNLNGLWNTSGPITSLAGVQTVATVTSSTITMTIPSSTNGAVSIDSTSSISEILRFTSQLQSQYITSLGITTSANVILTITISPGTTLNDFLQIYRTAVTSATGATFLSDLDAGDEQQLVYEAYPTQAQLNSGFMIVEDIVTEPFREGGAFLYTNQQTGEGILQENNVPPLSTDINVFKNVVFYSNTSNLQNQQLSLLGVQNLIDSYNNSQHPQLVISTQDGSSSNTYFFVVGANQETQITFSTETGSNYTSKYFTINSANNYDQYYVWYKVSGVGTDPMVSGRTGIMVLINSGDSGTTIATKTLNVLTSLVRDFNVTSSTSTLTITNLDVGYTNNSTSGTLGVTITVSTPIEGTGELAAPEITNITTTSATGLGGKYFTLNTAFDKHLYYVWYTVNGSGSDPMVTGRTGILIPVLSTDTATNVATKTANGINSSITTITATSNTNIVTTTNVNYGYAGAAMAATSGFSISITQLGALNVLLSTLASPAEAVNTTAESLIRIVNENPTEVVSGFYLSSSASIPGLMEFQARELSTGVVYFLADTVSGLSFSPNLTPTNTISSNTAANPTVITSTAHGLVDGDQIIISNSNSIPSINGVYVVTIIDANTLTIPVDVITAGITGAFTNINNLNSIVASSNQVTPNRIYYSKLLQPEAVPLVNFVDVGSKDYPILRIFPLRDSLMIFKGDGIYRLSGEVAPWTVSLLDISSILIAADSIGVTNNFIYGWTNRGIVNVSESGVSVISRPIDTQILPKNTPQYTNFLTATWGIGYNSDNTYIIYTVDQLNDTYATIAYVYNILTNTWTTYDKTNTCGVINPADDRLYMGAGDTNYIEQERKNFNRLDYADRIINSSLTAGNLINKGMQMMLESISGLKVGDVVTQEQMLTIYTYNALLQKLDIDLGIVDHDFFSNLNISPGADLRNAIVNLATQLVSDPGTTDKNYLNNIRSSSNNLLSNTATNPTVFSLPFTTFTPGDVNTGTNTITITNNGYSAGQLLQFTSTVSLPSGLTPGITYYIVNPTTNTFQVSLSFGGSVVPLGTTGSGVHTAQSVHGLVNNRYVQISDVANSVPSVNGNYFVTVVSPSSFSIPVSEVTPGVGGNFATLDNTFQDIQSCYNQIILELNLDSGIAFSNYTPSTGTTTQEAIITAITPSIDVITLNISLPFVIGPLIVYESIVSLFTYAPLTFGDPVHYKQINTCHVLFEDQTFTLATLNFATDLLPVFTSIPVPGQGNGIFGFSPSFGNGFFGGVGNSQPFRTYVPRNAQRCTFLTIQFTHQTAREKYSLNGISLIGNIGLSERSYR